MAIKKVMKMPPPVKIGGPLILQGGGLVMAAEKNLDFHKGTGGKTYTSSPMHQSAEDLLNAEFAQMQDALINHESPPDKAKATAEALMKYPLANHTGSGTEYPEEFIQIFTEVLKKGIAEELKKAIAPHPAMATFDKKEGTAQIDIKNADGTTSTSQEPVTPPKLFTSPACNVGVSSKLTIPIAPYTNAQVSVSLNIPCTHGEIDQVYDFAKTWIDVRMTALKKQIDQAKGVSG